MRSETCSQEASGRTNLMSRKAMSSVVVFIALGALLGGCAATIATPPPSASPVTDYGLRSANVDYLTASAAHPMGLPQAARPGDCYARAVVPAQYETVTEQVLKKEAGTRIEIVPAEFQDVEERILVRPAGKALEAIPPVYEEVEEQILVRPATTRVEAVPATYRTVTETILVRPAYTIWKRSSELTAAERSQQAVDPGAGDILCLVQVPDEFKTVTSEVLVTPATTREVAVPAEYTTVKKTVVKAPATTREVEVTAEYKTVKVRKLVTAERQITTPTPAEYDTVTKQVLRSTATAEWREVLCENNATPTTLAAIQKALREAGFDPGRQDGRVIEDDELRARLPGGQGPPRRQ